MKRILRHVGGKDFRKTHQRKLDEQRALYLEEREKEIQEENKKKKIEEAAKPYKSNWRSTLTESEWYAISGSGPTNSTSQTFAYGDPGSGIEVTLSGIGGVEAHPSTVTIDGEIYDAPTYNQLAMQGYAKPLGFDVTRRTDFQDVNPYLDASQEFAQAVGADYMMNARVSSEPEFRDPNIPLSDEEIEAQYQHNVGIADNFLKSVGTSYQEIVDKGIVLIDGRAYILVKENGKYQKLKIVKQNPHDSASISMGYTYNGEPYIENSIDEKEVYFHELENLKLPKLPTFTPKSETKIDSEKLNYSSPPGVRDDMLGGEYAKIANNTSMLPTFSGVPKFNPLAPLTQLPMGFPFLDAIGNTLRYATGNYDPKVPVKGGQSGALEASMLNTMSNAINSGTLSRDPGRPGFFKVGVYYDGIPKPGKPEGTEFGRNDWEGDGSLSNNYFANMSAQGLLQIYSFKPTKKGVIVTDRFNLDGSTFGGAAAALPGAQQLIDFLVRKGDAKIKKRGGDPKDDATAGFDLEYTIPWERIPNDHPLRGNIKESTTWDRTKKHLKGA